jgi:type IV pilus assembly protein PilM
MALFGKKSAGDSGPSGAGGATSDAPKGKGGLFGRGKKDDANGSGAGSAAAATPAGGTTTADFGFDDFGNDAFGAATPEVARVPLHTTRARPKVINGSAVGLNIGNYSIKVVELRARGGNIEVVGAASVHTPVESLSNGVIMSQGALAHAIRDAIQAAGIKSKAVTTAVAGTGSLVVRVVELPRMSDGELAETMKTDAEKFIPFAPEDVRLDFRPLRELPTPPDSPNMDVLIAAAQREVLYQYGDVVEAARLQARAIEVEPLAVARSLSHSVPGAEVDYGRVTAIINIGASSTEISVLRGDILVFTRTLPTGGHSLTQALVDYLGLSDSEAERVKQEFGDALPSFQQSAAPAAGTPFDAGGDDWSNFDFDSPDPTTDNANGDTDASTFESTSTTPTSATAVDDPFDPDFLNQPAPTTSVQSDAREQHGQKDGEDSNAPGAGQGTGQNAPQSFDFSSFDFEDLSPDPAASSSAASGAPGTSDAPDASADPLATAPTVSPGNFNFDFDVPAVEPDAGLSAAPSTATEITAASTQLDAPFAEASTSPTSAGAAAAPDPFDFSFDSPAVSEPASTPAASTSSPTLSPLAPGESETLIVSLQPPLGEAEAASTSASALVAPSPELSAPAAAPADFDFDFSTAAGPSDLAPTATDASSTLSAPLVPDTPPMDAVSSSELAGGLADDASAWGIDDLAASSSVPADATASAPGSASASSVDDLDLDALFSSVPGGQAAGDAAVMGAGAAGLGAAGAIGAIDDPFGTTSADLGDFGSGLTNDMAPGVDAPTVYSILHPLLDELAGEIRRSLEYHASRYPEAVVQNIELVGGGAKLRNLDAFLSQSLGIPATVGDPLRNMGGNIPAQARADAPAYAVAAGLALRELLA